MKISKRLRVIGDLVSDNSFILDVGCDHALLDIYVCLEKGCKAIASDINEKPLEKAKENIKKFKLEDKITIANADGLKSYKKGISTIVLSGLGTSTIIDILYKDKDKLKDINNLIISSNNDWEDLRRKVTLLGYKIEDEIIVKDKEKYYPVIKFIKGKEIYKDIEYKYGPILLKEKTSIMIEYLEKEKDKLLLIYKNLNKKHIFYKIKIKKEIRVINKIIKK